MSNPTSTSHDLDSPRTTRRLLLQGLGALAAAPWIAPAGAADKTAPLPLPLHLTQMVNHIGISVRDVRKSATFYSHLFEETHLLGQDKPALRYLINLHPGAVSVGPLDTHRPGGHPSPFIDHFAVSARPFDLAAWRARLDEQQLHYFAGGTFVVVNGIDVQLLGGHADRARRGARKGPAGAGFRPMPALYDGEPLVKVHGFKRVVLQLSNLDAATEAFRTLFGLPPHRTDSGRVSFQVGSIELELEDAPSGPSRIAAFGVKVAPFDRAKVSEALEALGAMIPTARGPGGARPFARRAMPSVANPAVLAFSDPDGIRCELWPL
jgi:catechol 2,3-dioxygenase-like lactoylglutathione lyase family enzyme